MKRHRTDTSGSRRDSSPPQKTSRPEISLESFLEPDSDLLKSLLIEHFGSDASAIIAMRGDLSNSEWLPMIKALRSGTSHHYIRMGDSLVPFWQFSKRNPLHKPEKLIVHGLPLKSGSNGFFCEIASIGVKYFFGQKARREICNYVVSYLKTTLEANRLKESTAIQIGKYMTTIQDSFETLKKKVRIPKVGQTMIMMRIDGISREILVEIESIQVG